MKIPLIILSGGAVFAGFFPFAHLITANGLPLETSIDPRSAIFPVTLATAGILLARRMYRKQNELPQKMASSLRGLYAPAYKKFYIDEIYLFITKKIIFNLIGKPAAWIDKNIVDGGMNLLATITAKISELIKGLQSGKVQNYALYFFSGIIGLALLFIYLWK
jgi:NADH-quinone oxidoreductase subunit L